MSSRPVRASFVSIACLLRGLPLFFRAAPRTPLRVLGIIALDTLHVLRHSRPLPRKKVHELTMFLDFEGCANAEWDHKELCEADYARVRADLQRAGLGSCIEAYLARLHELESRRPPLGGNRQRFEEVRAYREGVARLSIGTAAAIALIPECREPHLQDTAHDGDVDTLFRILMQCQVIDDVLDYDEDARAGLPSFLTASASLSQAMELTAAAARHYARSGERGPGHGVFPLRVALRVVTVLTQLIIRIAERRSATAGFGRVLVTHKRETHR